MKKDIENIKLKNKITELNDIINHQSKSIYNKYEDYYILQQQQRRTKKVIFSMLVIILFLLNAKVGAAIQEKKDKEKYNEQISLKDKTIESRNKDIIKLKLQIDNLKTELKSCKMELVKKN